MKIFVLGGYQYGLALLRRLIERSETVVGVFASPEEAHEASQYTGQIEDECRQHGIPFDRVERLEKANAARIQSNFAPDVIFCFGWRTMIPSSLLDLAPLGIIAAHGSLLPRLRGMAPASWAILLGHHEAGTTLIRLRSGMDEGEVYGQAAFPLSPGDTVAMVKDRIAELSVSLFEKYLDAEKDGGLEPLSQDHSCATYGCLRTPEDGEIDWKMPADRIVALVRATTLPCPVAYTYFEKRIVGILRANSVTPVRHYEGRVPGRVISRNANAGTIRVLAGDGIVEIEQVKLDDGTICAPTALIGHAGAYLGVRQTLEFADLHRSLSALEQRVRNLESRVDENQRPE